jgi:adenine deaminase
MSATWPADAYREMSETAADLPKLQRRIRVGLGEEPGDLLLVNAQVVNVFTARVEPASIVIADGWIAGVGQENWSAKEVIDVGGRYVAPGWIDSHMHLESTLLLPSELSRLVVPHGTTAIISDSHEIGNVLGVHGIDLLIKASQSLPLDVFFMASSCVPATAWGGCRGDHRRGRNRGVIETASNLGLGGSNGHACRLEG